MSSKNPVRLAIALGSSAGLALLALLPLEPLPAANVEAGPAAVHAAATGSEDLRCPNPAAPARAAVPVSGVRLGWYEAAPGDRFDHALQMQTEIKLYQADEQTLDFALVLDGTLRQMVLARRGEELLVELRLPSAHVTVSNGASREEDSQGKLTGGLGLPVIVRMDRSGQTLGLRFHPDQDAASAQSSAGLMPGG